MNNHERLATEGNLRIVAGEMERLSARIKRLQAARQAIVAILLEHREILSEHCAEEHLITGQLWLEREIELALRDADRLRAYSEALTRHLAA